MIASLSLPHLGIYRAKRRRRPYVRRNSYDRRHRNCLSVQAVGAAVPSPTQSRKEPNAQPGHPQYYTNEFQWWIVLKKFTRTETIKKLNQPPMKMVYMVMEVSRQEKIGGQSHKHKNPCSKVKGDENEKRHRRAQHSFHGDCISHKRLLRWERRPAEPFKTRQPLAAGTASESVREVFQLVWVYL